VGTGGQTLRVVLETAEPMGRSRYKITSNEQPHFLTCTVVKWLPLFSRPETARIILDSLRYLQSREELSVFGFVIMENHIHLIVSAKDLSNAIRRFKSFTARKIIDHLKERGEKWILTHFREEKASHKKDREYQFWQEGTHPVVIQNEEIMLQKLEYLHNNPVRRGYVDDPTHWRHSSARNYAGHDGLIDVEVSWY
jgi:REP element-mobilizing transposase RayT